MLLVQEHVEAPGCTGVVLMSLPASRDSVSSCGWGLVRDFAGVEVDEGESGRGGGGPVVCWAREWRSWAKAWARVCWLVSLVCRA